MQDVHGCCSQDGNSKSSDQNMLVKKSEKSKKERNKEETGKASI